MKLLMLAQVVAILGSIAVARAVLAADVPLPAKRSAGAAKAPTKATLDLEWEAVQEADGYEVELTPVKGGSPQVFTTKDSAFSQQLEVGTYKLRIRSRETESGVYGEWSEATEVDVSAKQIGLLAPDNEAEFGVENGSEFSVDFKWSPATGARVYNLKVWPDEEPKNVQVYKTTETSLRVKLASMKIYHWNVTFETNNADYSVSPKARWFIIKGPKLSTPMIYEIEDKTVTELSWRESPGVEDYEALLYRRCLDETDFKPYLQAPAGKSTIWNFTKLPAGVYRAEVTAHSKFRASSEMDSLEFTVKPSKQDVIQALRGAILDETRAPATAEAAHATGKGKPAKN